MSHCGRPQSLGSRGRSRSFIHLCVPECTVRFAEQLQSELVLLATWAEPPTERTGNSGLFRGSMGDKMTVKKFTKM